MKAFIGIFLTLLFFLGCSKNKDDVALVVNGKKYTKQQIAKAAVVFRQNVIRAMPEKSIESFTSDLRSTVARELITNQLMFEDSKKRKIQVDSNMVNKAFERLKSSYPSADDFENELTAMGETQNDVKKELEKGALLDTLLKVILADADTATEQEYLDFYTKNSNHYTSSPRFRVSQIFFQADSLKDRANWEKNRRDALSLFNKLKAGQKFEAAAAAKNQSDGDMGWFKNGDLKPELQKAIEQKKIGELSEVICTDIGFHILKKTGEEQARVLAYDEVKDNIMKTVSLQKRSDYISKYVDSLISRAKITYVDTTLKKLID